LALYLVQHGKSLPKDADPDQGLSEEGTAETERIAAVAKEYQVKVGRIQHSGKTRARQTAEIFAKHLMKHMDIDEVVGLKPLDEVSAFAANIKPEENTMLVGHLPFMERMAAYLVTGSEQKPIFKFQNSGVVCLDVDPDTESWVIKWALVPRIN
jgi:phosphohistidine phosphatase